MVLITEKRKRRLKTQEEIQKMAKKYDINGTKRFDKEYVHVFDSVYRNYARILSNSLFLRFKIPMKLRLEELSQISYSDYINSIEEQLGKGSVTTIYSLYPMKGPFCLSINSHLAFSGIDSLLGGSFGNEAPAREFTDVEKGVLRRVVDAFIASQDQCYQEYGRVDPVIRSIEFNPVLMQLCSEDESMLILDFVLEANEKEYPIKIAIPYGSIENISDVLQLVRHQEDLTDAPTEQSREQLAYHLKQAKVNTTVILGESKLTIDQVENLQIGQLIKLNRKVGDFLDFKVEDEIRFKVQPGKAGKKAAVQITEILNPIRR